MGCIVQDIFFIFHHKAEVSGFQPVSTSWEDKVHGGARWSINLFS